MKLSEKLKHCLEHRGCAECECFEKRSVLICRNLLQSAYEQIKEYEELEEQGKLLKLPCAIGDTVYVLRDSKIEAQTIFSCYNYNFSIDHIGKTVFFTKEAAEVALKEMNQHL